MKDVICFEVNDWHRYPKFFDEWFDFGNEKHKGKNWLKDLGSYAKENRLCIKVVCVDMAISLVITAPKSWVKENIPEFEDEKWRWECVYDYPSPWKNDCPYHPFSGFTLENSPEEHLKERESKLWMLHQQFSDEEIENFRPHNILGIPSGELFLDWIPENYGAREWEDGKPFEDNP